MLSIVAYEILEEAIQECLQSRNAVNDKDQNENYIEMTPDLYKAICEDIRNQSKYFSLLDIC